MNGIARLLVVLMVLVAYVYVRSVIYGYFMGCDPTGWWTTSIPCDLGWWWGTWLIAVPLTLIAGMAVAGIIGAVLWVAEGFKS